MICRKIIDILRNDNRHENWDYKKDKQKNRQWDNGRTADQSEQAFYAHHLKEDIQPVKTTEISPEHSQRDPWYDARRS